MGGEWAARPFVPIQTDPLAHDAPKRLPICGICAICG